MLPTHVDFPVVVGAQAEHRFVQLSLPAAGYSGHAHPLALIDVEFDVAQRVATTVSSNGDVADPECLLAPSDSVGCAGDWLYRLADHCFDQFVVVER